MGSEGRSVMIVSLYRYLFWPLLLGLWSSWLWLASSLQAEGPSLGCETSYPLARCERVCFQGKGRLILESGDEPSLSIKMEKGWIPLVYWSLRQGSLVISVAEAPFAPVDSLPLFRLRLPLLERLEAGGSTCIESAAFTADSRLKLQLSGRSRADLTLDGQLLRVDLCDEASAKLQGRVEKQVIDQRGSGQYSAFDLFSQRSKVRLYGTGWVELQVKSFLSAEILGSGQLIYQGVPAIREKIAGAGAVTPCLGPSCHPVRERSLALPAMR